LLEETTLKGSESEQHHNETLSNMSSWTTAASARAIQQTNVEGTIQKVKEILSSFSYPYNRRIAGQHGHFTMEDYEKWLNKAERNDLAQALNRLAQLNQRKVYLLWKKHQS